MRGLDAHVLGTAAGFAADLLTADPEHGHPVAAFGRAAAALERLLWRDSRAAGAAHTTLCVTATAAAVAALTHTGRRPPLFRAGAGNAARGHSAVGSRGGTGRGVAHPVAEGVVSALVTWAVLGGSSLARE